jgi:hypothetical protein
MKAEIYLSNNDKTQHWVEVGAGSKDAAGKDLPACFRNPEALPALGFCVDVLRYEDAAPVVDTRPRTLQELREQHDREFTEAREKRYNARKAQGLTVGPKVAAMREAGENHAQAVQDARASRQHGVALSTGSPTDRGPGQSLQPK